MAVNALVNLSDAAAGWGVTYYNGYTFPGLRQVKLAGEMIYDQANRVVELTRYKLRLVFYAKHSSSSAHAAGMEQLRQLLQEPGGVLRVTGQGFGDIYINDAAAGAANRYDVEFGPRPANLEMTQIGMLCHECSWECAFSVKEGFTAGAGAAAAISAFNYGMDFDFDDAGILTRTVAGYLQIHIPRTPGSRTVVSSADFYRGQLRLPIPAGFRRTARRFSLSQDRRRLDFSFSDRQLDGEAPLPNALKSDLDYTIESVPPGFAKFQASLGGSIEVPVGTPPIRAAEVFMLIFADKQKKLSSAVKGSGIVIPTRISFGRPIGSRVSQFDVQWMVTGCLDDLLKNGGIWDPVSGAAWAAWAQSMAAAWGTSNANMGPTGLAYSSSLDVLVDLNYGAALPAMGAGATDANASAEGSKVFTFDVPAEQSWLYYENTLVAQRAQNYRTHTPIEEFSAAVQSTWNPAVEEGAAFGNAGSTLTSVTQYQGRPTDLILMKGKAMRLQHQPSIPRLVSVAGKQVVECKTVYEGPKIVGCIFGKKVYTSRWAILYRLREGYIGPIPEQPNPSLCCAK